MIFATGADIPPELVYRILSLLATGYYSKEGLAACSQVCRYWARYLRPLLFKNITLRSLDDIVKILEFLDADVMEPPLAQCIGPGIYIRLRGSQPAPWVHHIPRLSRRLTSKVFISLTEIGADTSRNTRTQTHLAFYSLPRALPRTFFADVPLRHLTLKNA